MYLWLSHKELIGFGFESLYRFIRKKKKEFNIARNIYCLPQLKSDNKIFEIILKNEFYSQRWAKLEANIESLIETFYKSVSLKSK